ncbi:nuclear transport factor 2 family protein [Dactylosporangium sp. NPDC000244]|uniref:nuclear transport factor 2 family protein n=1 Tax=Dactylosporangium sp. NPDC000244 TaxID=3154365 RepID=UPI00332F565F
MTAPLDVARDMIDAWNRMDWDRVVALFAEDGVLHSVMQEPIVGRPGIETRIRSLTAGLERIELRVKAMGVIDGRVFIERVDDFDIHGHHVELPVVGILRIGSSGLVTEWLEYYDRASMMRGMGLPADFSHS